MLKLFFGLDLNQEVEVSMDFCLGLEVNTLDLSAPISMCRSHMVGAFSQNSVTLTGLPMISLSESDLTYPL